MLNQSLKILETQDRLLIKGSAGVGKTFMVNSLIKSLITKLNNNTSKIYCSAPTNKAVKVLKEKIDSHEKIELLTTHSALKLKRIIDYKTGEISFKPSYDKNPPLRNVGVFIIDESSMLNTSLLMDVETHATKNNCKVIFIGDNQQLNPVGEEHSPVFLGKPILTNPEENSENEFLMEYEKDLFVRFEPYPQVELREIVRQKEGNPIIDLSRNLDQISKKEPNKNAVGGYIYSNDLNKVVETLSYVNGSDELKYLAYTNAEVDKINNLVRQNIYGVPNKIEKEEILIFNSPYKDVYFTNEEIKIENIEIKEKKFTFMTSNNSGVKEPDYEEISLKYYSINNYKTQIPAFKSLDSWEVSEYNSEDVENVIVIHEDSEKDFSRVCQLLKRNAKAGMITWAEYYRFSEQFADLKYNHALTIHKSQGSSYKQAIVNIGNININRNSTEKQKLLYTAVTRASDLLILYNI